MKFILLLFKLYIIILIIIGCFDNSNQSAYSKDVNCKIDNNTQHITQLHQIADAHSQCLIQIQKQLAENQRDIDILRGHIQDAQHHISDIIHDQKKTYKKTSTETTKKMYNDTYNFTSNNSNNTSDTTFIHSDIAQQYQDINNYTPIIDDVDNAYKKAVALVLEKKQYNQAIEAFQKFIKNYPDSIYQVNAQYWLGQLYYNNGNKNDATYYFALVVKNHPKSLKAPDALLKLGIIMQESEEKDKAKTIYRQIGKLYPSSDAAKQAQKRLTHLLK